MRKKIFGGIAVLFAAATAFNIGLLQTQDAGDISLDAIAIMAQARGESGNGGHSATYTCYDPIETLDKKPFIGGSYERVCWAQNCEKKWIRGIPDKGSCTVWY